MKHPTESQIDAFVQEFVSKSDRLLVIVAVSLIDSHLTEFIRRRLLPSRLDRALGKFSAKINLAYRFGLIDAAFSDVLHCLRKIRNAYAHLPTPGGLDSGDQSIFLKRALAKFENDKAIWWDASSDPYNMSFRSISLHIITKLMIGMEPERKVDLPIPLKPSPVELQFFDLLGGKLGH